MLIQKLWEENPKLVEDEIRSLFGINECENFGFVKIDKERLLFVRRGVVTTRISVGDFDIRTSYSADNYAESSLSEDWRIFMRDLFGLEYYAQNLITYRNNDRDRRLAELKGRHNKDTINMLAKLGIKKYQDMQSLTK